MYKNLKTSFQYDFDRSYNEVQIKSLCLRIKGDEYFYAKVIAELMKLPKHAYGTGKASCASIVSFLNETEVRETDFGSGKFLVSSKNLLGMLKFLAMVPRGDILMSSQTKMGWAAINVPYLLAAAKLAYKVPYEAWDFSDPTFWEFNPTDYMYFRLEDSSLTPTPDWLKYWRMDRPYGMKPTGDAAFDALPLKTRLMLIQRWIWKHPDPLAIVNPLDWDSTEPLYNDLFMVKQTPWNFITLEYMLSGL